MSKQDTATLDRLVREKHKDPNWEIFPHGTILDATKAVYADILEGFRDLEDAKDYIEGMEDDRVMYTARGDEIRFSLLRRIIEHVQRNPDYSPWGGESVKPPSKHHTSIMWTRESSPRRGEILKELSLPVEPYWAQPFAKLPVHFKEKLAEYYARERMPMTKKGKDRRTAFYIQFWSPKTEQELAQPYYWDGPEDRGAFKTLGDALRAAGRLEDKRPDAFNIDIYSQEEIWQPDEEDPRYGQWEPIEGTMKMYDRRGAIVFDEGEGGGRVPQTEDKLFGRYHRPLPDEAY